MSLRVSRWIGTAIYVATVVVALGVAWKLHAADLPGWRYVFVAVLLVHIALWCLRAYFTHVIKRWSTHTVSVGWAIFFGIETGDLVTLSMDSAATKASDRVYAEGGAHSLQSETKFDWGCGGK